VHLEFIPVLYNPGHFGTWISWLINQHLRFPKYSCCPAQRNLPVQADIWSEQGDFNYHKNLSDWDLYYSYVIDYQTKFYKNVSKFSFKFLPNQNFIKDDKSLDVDEINKIFSYIGVKKTVITFVDTTLLSEIKKRWEYLEDYEYGAIDAEMLYKWQLANIPNYDKINAEYLLLDVGKMLLGSVDEYKKLTDFIDEPPLDNFKELCKSHYDFAFYFMNSINKIAIELKNYNYKVGV